MAADNSQFQLVSFRLGNELYGINIMDVKEIVKTQEVRSIPNAPFYIEGIINLRGEIIPIINLHKRFQIQKVEASADEVDEGGFIIIQLAGKKVGIIIDHIVRVVTVEKADVKEPPQMLSGIGTEYIQGVYRTEQEYLVILDTNKLFDAKELQKVLGN